VDLVRIALVAAIASIAGCSGAAEEQAPTRSLTILHTNDLHARLLPDDKGRGGFAELATVFREQCAGAAACLVLDAGDMVQGTPVSTLFEGVPVYEVADRMGFDASTLGNHEFDYGSEKIAQFADAASFPILSANMIHPAGGRLGDGPTTVLTTDNGIRVGIVGVVTESLPYVVDPHGLGQWKALPVRETVASIVPELRSKADLIVVLGHLTGEEEAALLDVPGVDLVVSGHDHSGLREPLTDDDTVVVRVRAWGHEVGRLDAVIDVDANRVSSWTWDRIPVRSGVEPDPRTNEIVQAWERKVSKLVDIPLARVTRDFDRREMKDLFERAMREETGADLAHINSGAVRDNFRQGDLLVRGVWNAMPFDDRVVTATVRGSQLPESIRKEHGLKPEGTYRLTSIDFVVAQWKLRGTAGIEVEEGELLRDLLLRWIGKRGRL